MMETQRYIVGIDLGTTNCVLSFYDLLKPESGIHQYRIIQAGKYGYEESLPLLPSFLFLQDDQTEVVGLWAKTQGAKIPTRLVHSAKSWLTNPAANRREKILPAEAPANERKISPMEASSAFLIHICRSWNQTIAKGNEALFLQEQEIILTIPASFDEVARNLTLEAAKLAGLKYVTLLEEPQAALYAWIMEHGSESFHAGETILVCDVGGGTSDFSLIDVLNHTELQRMAVGKHLLLGGDNMDAALCHYIENKIGEPLDLSQHLLLLQQAREVKEIFFSAQPPASHSFFLSGKGSHVVAGGVSCHVTRKEIEAILLEGFFGLYGWEEAIQLKKGGGIRQMGLPFENDPSITKHLASFLAKNGNGKKPSCVLFNGGSLKPKMFQQRILDSLDLWFIEKKSLRVLQSSHLDLSVSRGAAYYGKMRQLGKATIGGGSPRTYYLEVEINGCKSALTVLPRGTAEDTRMLSEKEFLLSPNTPVSFQLYHSTTRMHDSAGSLVEILEEDLTSLPPVKTICQFGKKEQKNKIPVQLEIYLTAIGIVELWILSKTTQYRWKLEFQLNAHLNEMRLADQALDVQLLEKAQLEIQEAFAVGSKGKLNSVISALEACLEKEKKLWPPSVLRSLFETLLMQADKRRLSVQYESRFWNLSGFFLRPGTGYPLDDFRLKQLWKLILFDFKKTTNEEVLIQQWICYRRISAGLNKGQQIQLYSELVQSKTKKKGYAYAEHLRALASLELVDIHSKIKLGNQLLKKIKSQEGEPCDYWALGRIGARQLLYGTIANVIPPEICENWVRQLLNVPIHEYVSFTLAQLARGAQCRSIDLSPQLVQEIEPLVGEAGFTELLLSERSLTFHETERLFGDSLPIGLTLASPDYSK
jgi:hypothetical protein